MSIVRPDRAQEERKMTHYQQTLLIPRPKQSLPNYPKDGRRGRHTGYGNRRSPDHQVNSILSYFD